ncbi:MAG: SIMPL domain-containing protein, partial [Bryobacteraceae bacterium]
MRALPAIFLFAAIAAAQEPAKTLHIVRASGEATITAKPDRAQISLGVETNASTAEAAASQNAVQSTKLLDAIKHVLGSAGGIATSQYALAPVYKNNEGETVLAGYRADNTVVVKTGDLALVAKILDVATQAGANNVEGIAFTLRDDEAVRARALAQAAQRARANAEAIARA